MRPSTSSHVHGGTRQGGGQTSSSQDLGDPDTGLIRLAVKRGLLSSEKAQTILGRLGSRPAVVALVEDGHLSEVHVRDLRAEQKRQSIPAQIGVWKIVSHLGNGGMSVVFKAVDAQGREAALKLMSPRVDDDALSTSRFLREIRAAFAVDHRHVIRSWDSGEVNGRPWIAQEFMPGGDCERLVAHAGGPLPERQALRIAAQCARGLAAIHAAGLMHRDIKPANIFLDRRGEAKLADLGLARQINGDDALTMAGVRVGTPAYMSPEQASGAELDPRCDVYALGATLYFLATGRRPFRGANHFELLMEVVRAPRPDPVAANPALSTPACWVIRRAMQVERGRRYRDAVQFAQACEEILHGRSDAQRPARPRTQPPRRRTWFARLLAGLRGGRST